MVGGVLFIAYVIPESVTSIGRKSFSKCSNLTNITIPQNVQLIFSEAFYLVPLVHNLSLVDGSPWGAIEVHNYDVENCPICGNYGANNVESKILKKSGNFYFRSDLSKLISDSNGSLHNTYNYDESWFFNDSTSYQHELVQMSVRVALAAFGEGENSTEKNIRELMEGADSLKFSDVDYSYPIPSEESIGFAIGSKNIVADDGEKCSLILLAVRGGGYYDEWAGNFHIGEGSRHEGFEYAALQVEEGLLNYLNTYEEKLSNNLKIWITGYSRGAATANLVAADLDNGYIDGLDQKDIFAFCFECPQNTTDPEATDASMYGNIINIINPIDIVTKVAMSDWGFGRYGKSLYLPNVVNNSRYFILKGKMAGYYSNLLHYNGYGSLLDSSVKAVSLTDEVLAQAILVDKFSSNLASVFADRSDYVLRTEVDMMETMAYVMGGTECDDMFMVSALIDTVPDLVKKYPINTSNILLAAKCIGQAHYPELCMSWIDSLDDDRDVLFDVSDYRYKIVYVNCPVDVAVYDSDENMVVHIVDNTVEEIENGLVAYIDDNDQKVIAIPQDADYHVQLSATDNGHMTYTIADYNMQTGSCDQVISYVEVEIEEGNTYSSDILRFNEETEDDISTLRKEGQDALEPDINESGGEVSNWTVDVNSSGNGIVTGGGRFTSGEFSKVTAVPDEGEEFLGWYCGEKLVSEELEYRFQVKEDIVLVAKFTENCKDISSCKIILEEVNYAYDGTGKKPAVTVKNDSIVLDDEIDYTLTYENNINAGTAVVTITGIGAYKGKVTKEFTINRADQIVGANVSSEVKVGKQSVVTGTGIGTISYETSDEMIAIVDDKGVITGISPGTVIITVTASGDNNYNSASKAIHIIVTKDKEYSIGEWKQNSKGWWYENPDGTYPYSCWKEIDGNWYYFNASGYRVTGWQKIKNTWYYFETTTGIMYEEQWLELAGKSYYLKKGGAMATGWLELEEGWYYLNSSGIRVTGWMQSGGNWYYLDPVTGVMFENQWLENTYYLKSGGAMVTGWQKIDGKWYYFQSSGAKATGWLKSGSSWYYFEPTTGIMYESEWLDDTYYLKSSGAMATGWQLIGEDYYYFDTSGKKVTGKWVGNYYLKADGVMARSEWVDNDRYYVDENGK